MKDGSYNPVSISELPGASRGEGQESLAYENKANKEMLLEQDKKKNVALLAAAGRKEHDKSDALRTQVDKKMHSRMVAAKVMIKRDLAAGALEAIS